MEALPYLKFRHGQTRIVRRWKAYQDAQPALVPDRFERDGGAMAQDNALDDGQPEPAAGRIRPDLARKPVEGAFAVFSRYPRPVVFHREDRLKILRSYADVDAAAALGVADRVVDQIAKHRAQGFEISRDPYRLVTVDADVDR